MNDRIFLAAARWSVLQTLIAFSAILMPAGAEPASASPAHRMILLAYMHTCDFQPVSHVFGRTGAEPFAEITSDGHTAVAHIDLTSATPDATYLTRMIPAPHAILGCQPGNPTITTGTLATDDRGAGTATLRANIHSGITGMWLALDLPSAHSQTPQEFYSSNYIASV